MAKVINVRKKFLNELGYKDLEEWLKVPSHIYIGRDMTYCIKGAIKSKWCNPFKGVADVNKCLELYENYILKTPELYDNLHELENKILGCWCVTENNNLCHGNILVKLLNNKKS